jgi:ubiquinone/menaquinone biosynthesis C-methylase UbiE
VDSKDWNSKYSASERLWSWEPNQFVAEELADLPAGKALDLAAGEGRNALWLANRGFQVTAIDFSDIAIERAREADTDSKVNWVVADVLSCELDEAGYDLVLLSYLQLPADKMRAVLERAREALAPGGTLLLIGHDVRNLEEGTGGPQSAEVLYSPQDIVAALEGLDIARAETVERVVKKESGTSVALDCLVRAVRKA